MFKQIPGLKELSIPKVAESQLIAEEDVELYTPIIGTLKQDYMQGLQNSGLVQKQPQGAK